jgi:glucose-6-phosphate isomerase
MRFDLIGEVLYGTAMNTDTKGNWERFKRFYYEFPQAELALDLSPLGILENFPQQMRSRFDVVFKEMAALEKGSIANPDEGRMVGHYWLRNPQLAPTDEIRREIEENIDRIKQFSKQVHQGEIRGSHGKFRHLLLIGIGGSALGPQFVSNALSRPGRDKMTFTCIDNTDPDGFERVLSQLRPRLGKTLVLVISKSGGTKETRNGMITVRHAYEKCGLNFANHAVAVTGQGSELDQLAQSDGWIHRFPMWDWVGGRTSELSAVGLLPAALQGFKIDKILRGARICDQLTRRAKLEENPAALLAISWYHACEGKGTKDMVILPYKDRLELLSRYLQQLIMESLGKERDLNGRIVHQGITVFGNKGSTDQHAYIQQLRDGLNNFFVTFIEVLTDCQNQAELPEVENGITAGDYLHSFLLGTQKALSDNGRQSLTITVREVSAFSVGVLIALFERAVGFYASLIGINAYHQPGVEAGKKAAGSLLNLKSLIISFLNKSSSTHTVEEIADGIGKKTHLAQIFKLCEHLSSNERYSILRVSGSGPENHRYGKSH